MARKRNDIYSTVRALIKTLNIKNDVREYIAFYADMGIKSAEQGLKSFNFSKAYSMPGRERRNKPEFYEFAQSLAEELPSGLYNAEKLARLCRDSLRLLIFEKQTELSELVKDPVYAPVVERLLTEKLADYRIKPRIVHAVNSSFTLEKVLDCLAVNPFTAKAASTYADKFGWVSQLRKAILERVPEDIKELYPIARELKRHFVIHTGPTNSGKTHDALESFKKAESGVYLGPLRLLAFEVYETSNECGLPCSMITGEERIEIPCSYHTASTIEMLDTDEHYELAVIDECQMIADSERGGAWTRAILGVNADEVHLCCSPDARDILIKLCEYCGDTWELIEHKRRSELIFESEKFYFPRSVREGDALIVFSKRAVQSCAAELQEKGISCSVIYGSLPYDVRQNEVRRFLSGETKVVVATDAIGMGLNLPVDRIVFLETEKFDGHEMRHLKPGEIQQIAGRAGRNDKKPGYVNASHDRHSVSEALSYELPAIGSVSLGFPRELLRIDSSVSDIMSNWCELETREPFIKSELTEEIKLAMELEKYSNDKEKIFSFVMIPFKESDKTLHQDWLRLFKFYAAGEQKSFSELCFYYDSEDLASMELAYQQNDLLFYYMRLTEQREEQELIMDEKRQISADINAYLKQHPLEAQKCKLCGRPLPWNYRYGICGRCNNKLRQQRYSHSEIVKY